MKIILKWLTPEIYEDYDIHNLAHNGYINMKIRKGMPGLKEAGVLAFNYIANILYLLDTIGFNSPQDFGNTRQGKQLLICVLITLALNPGVKTTKNILKMYFTLNMTRNNIPRE